MVSPLFFIALLPDEEIQEEVTQFKAYAAERFRSSRALRSPPHITLIPPFRWPDGRVEELCAVLEPFAGEEKPFRLGLNNFGCFPPRVIFVEVERKVELLELQWRLEAYLAASLGLAFKSRHDYNPHMTVAFKDLHRRVFPEAWAHFSQQQYQREFIAGALTLLQHDGRRWQVLEQFGFGGE